MFPESRVNFSGTQEILGEIRYLPLVKRALSENDITRIVLLMALKKHIKGIDPDVPAHCGELDHHFIHARSAVNAMADLDITILYDFCQSNEEIKKLSSIVRECFLSLRDCFNN